MFLHNCERLCHDTLRSSLWTHFVSSANVVLSIFLHSAAMSANKGVYEVSRFSVIEKDHCGANTTNHDRKGDINWPVTSVGSRRIVHCPYAYDQPSYAHRDCILLVSSQSSTWGEANVTSCPYSPFSQGVDRLGSFVVSIHV